MGNKVVIVDDAAFIREVLTQILVRSGFEVIGEAVNGDEAVQVVLEKKPDIVLMDIIMPLKSGIQATKEILEKNAKQKIIALSTEDSETMIMRALEAGCCDYIVKPFNREKLIQAINKAVQLEGGAQ